MKLLSILIITFLQMTSIAWAQTDTIPKKNKERKFHAGIFYSVGLSYLSVQPESGIKVSSDFGSYQNWGLMVETKLYKNFWLELNANKLLSRSGQFNLTNDTIDIDVQIKNNKENTIVLYLKYKVLQKKKINVMAKAGVGFGTILLNVYTKNNRLQETEYYHQPDVIGNLNYYSFSMGIDANYQLNKHIILFNQLVYDMGTNALREYDLFITRRYTNSFIYLKNTTPHTLIYSLGLKF